MASAKITFADKVGIIPKETRINQVWDDDVNEIKTKHNFNANLIDTNTTDIATNVTNIALKANKHNIVIKSVDYTAIINDYILVSTPIENITITLPNAVDVGGQEINITKMDSTEFDIIVNTSASQTIIGNLTETISTQWVNATFVSTGSNWVIK